MAAIEKVNSSKEDPEEAARYREKAKLKKQEQRKAEKIREGAAGVQKLNTPEKCKIKTLKQRIKSQLKKDFATPCNSTCSSIALSEPCSSSTPDNPERLLVSKAIWAHMSPKSKHKVKLSLKITLCVDRGLNCAVREELGLNISSPSSPGDMLETALQKEIKLFFDRADVAKPCPDTKCMVCDSYGTGKHLPV